MSYGVNTVRFIFLALSSMADNGCRVINVMDQQMVSVMGDYDCRIGLLYRTYMYALRSTSGEHLRLTV